MWLHVVDNSKIRMMAHVKLGNASTIAHIAIHLSHDGHVLAISLFDWGQEFCDFLEQKVVDLDTIDALALRPTQSPDPWCFTVLARTSDVSTMQEFSPALKSQMPHMQSAGRLIVKWMRLSEKGWDSEVWDDEMVSRQENDDESADEESSGESDDEKRGN